jgi:phosphate transport system permease protein
VEIEASAMIRRKIVSQVVVVLCGVAVVLALVPLAMILFYVIAHGATALNLAFFTQVPRPVGESGGGMANAIVGTLVLISIAAAIAVPLGVMCGIHVSEFGGTAFASVVRFAADVLNGVPSIVIGIFAYGVLVLPMKRFSALAGGFALALMMLPLVVRTTEELLRLVPASLREGALALGATRTRAMFTVILPAALPGIVTGVLVAVARVAGETAPLLFTAFNNRFWSMSLTEPIGSLTVQVFSYAISPYDEWHRQAWAGAFVLVMMTLLLSMAARLGLRRLERMHRG